VKKKSVKQEINMMLTKLKKTEAVYTKARSLKYKVTKECDDAWKEVNKIRIAIAKKACPFKVGEIVKHYSSGYAKITRIEDVILFKEPYYQIFGKRIKADHKTFKDKESKKLNAVDWLKIKKEVENVYSC